MTARQDRNRPDRPPYRVTLSQTDNTCLYPAVDFAVSMEYNIYCFKKDAGVAQG